MKTYSPATLPEVLTITVTEDDVANGQPHHPCGCPAWLALTRTYPPEAGFWNIDRVWASVRDDNDAGRYLATYINPPELRAAIDGFDERKGFSAGIAGAFPGVFTLTRKPGRP